MTKRLLQTIASQLPVTSYLDYRDYLQELYVRAKAATSPYSYLTFAGDLGFSETNVIRLVIARQRQLADKSAQTIVKALDLRKADRKYFLAMVKHSNSRGAALRDRHFHKMLEAKQASIAEGGDRDRMEYYSEWYYPVVRELVRLDGFKSDPAWMAGRLYPSVSAEKVQRAVALLQALGLLRLDAAGRLDVAEESPMLLPADAAAGHLSVTQYHQAMLEVAKEAVTKVPASHREMNALTISVSDATFEILRQKIRDFCAEIMTLEARPQARHGVTQLNIQLFALTKPEGSE